MKKTIKSLRILHSKVAISIVLVIFLLLQAFVVKQSMSMILTSLIVLQILIVFFWKKTIVMWQENPINKWIYTIYSLGLFLVWNLGLIPLQGFGLFLWIYSWILMAFLLYFLSKKAYEEAVITLMMGSIFLLIFGIIAFWGEQKIWIIPALFFSEIIILDSKKRKVSSNFSKNLDSIELGSLGAFVLACSISTIIEFWIVGKFFLMIILAIAILVGITYFLYFLYKKEKEKKAEFFRQERYEILEEKLLTDPVISWYDLDNAYFNQEIPEKLLLKEHQMFFQSSSAKKEIRFSPGVVHRMLYAQNTFYRESMDDRKIYKLKKIIEDNTSLLSSFRGYKGFAPLIKLLQENNLEICKLYLDELNNK